MGGYARIEQDFMTAVLYDGVPEQVSGSVQLIPKVPYGTLWRLDSGEDIYTVPASPINCDIVNGKLSKNGEPYVDIFADDLGTVWSAIYTNILMDGQPYHIYPVDFEVKPGEYTDLNRLGEVLPEPVWITLGTGREARDQLRAALSDRGLGYATVTEIPFDIKLVGTGSAYDMFSGCSSLTSVPAMDTSGVTNMFAMFYNCSSLTHVPDMDTAQVMDMSYMFYNCAVLTDGNVRLIGRNPKVNTTDMILNSGLTREPWYKADGTPVEVVQITLGTGFEARDQFRAALSGRGLGYSTITEIPFEIDLVGTGSVEQLFQNCYALTTVPEMDTSQATNVQDMFSQCRALTHVPDMDTSQATNMRGVFYNCQALTHAPVLDTSQAVDTPYLFANCSSLTYVPDMDTSQVTGMRSMFSGCSSLTHGPALNTSQVVDSAYMYQNCTSLIYVPDMHVPQNMDVYAMFKNCPLLTDGNVRLIDPMDLNDVNILSMIADSGLTREPFYDIFGNPI